MKLYWLLNEVDQKTGESSEKVSVALQIKWSEGNGNAQNVSGGSLTEPVN
jgi:hypothetical protein